MREEADSVVDDMAGVHSTSEEAAAIDDSRKLSLYLKITYFTCEIDAQSEEREENGGPLDSTSFQDTTLVAKKIHQQSRL